MKQIISPHPGPQTEFLQSSADITIYGGACAGGKSFGILLAALRNSNSPHHNAVIFRKTSPMLRANGSIFREAQQLYTSIGADCNETLMRFSFKSGARISFSHLATSDKRFSHQGAAYSFIAFDELTHMQKEDFIYLISRLRNPHLKCQCVASCNPDSSSFVKDLIAPFLDSSLQFPDKAACKKTLYVKFSNEENNAFVFSDSPGEGFLSLRFIPASIEDNPSISERDPGYRERLLSLSHVEKCQLLYGDWGVSFSAGHVFNRGSFIFIDELAIPGDFALGFDLASTLPSVKNRDPDYCAAVLMQKNGPNRYIHRAWKTRLPAGSVYNWMAGVCKESIAISQRRGSPINAYVEIEPGSASSRELVNIKQNLAFISVEGVRSSSSKIIRARSLSDACHKGSVFIHKGTWTEEFVRELEAFPTQGVHDDLVDAASICFGQLQMFKY